MATSLHLISSMATKSILQDLAADFERQTGISVRVESVGGVTAAQRVAAGESFDIVVLAADAIDKLSSQQHIVAGTRTDLVRSSTAVAVRAGASHPDISNEAAVRAAVLAAKSLSYSTGPSGVQLAKRFEQWGIADDLQDRIIQAPPGVPVGSLVAKGEVELGFQQLSELLPLAGIDILGPLPDDMAIVTTFSGGIAASSQQAEAGRQLLAYLASDATTATKQAHGMDAA
ncbi:extracellular solute-binding protein [Kerstersia similis]|uniref:substrate-binding domain-containing protein n=1 Tax=Kerstersia similis TaxID=206505 RepID=UPI0039EF42E2